MFGRVSSVPSLDFFLAYPSSYDSFPSAGVYLGKKFTDQYTSSGYGSFYPKVDGWVDVDSNGTRSYPDYSFPEDLPPWFITKTKDYSGNIINAKRYIIETDGCIGPFTLHEILYIFSTVKEFKVGQFSQTIGISGAGLSISLSLSSGLEFEFSPIFEPDEDNPEHLFASEFKGRTTLGFYENDQQGSVNEEGIGESLSASVEAFVGGDYGSYGDTAVSIIADVDNLSEYYITNYVGPIYKLELSAGAYKGIEGPPEPPSTEPTTKSSSESISKFINLSIRKFKIEVNGTELSNVGDSASTTQNNQTIEVKYIGGTCDFTIGSLNKTVPTYGTVYKLTSTESNGGPSVSLNITGDELSSGVPIKAAKFWPYKNADDLPVYDETTGTITNPPIP
jgi:hypothetical protein